MKDEDPTDGYCRIGDHPNLYNRALTIIKRKGYELFLFPVKEDYPSAGVFYAKKGNRNFSADDPLRLLGIINIWETHGDSWYDAPKFESEKIKQQLMNEAYPDSAEDYEALSPEEYTAFVKKCQSFFSLFYLPKVKVPDDIEAEDLFAIISSLTNDDDYDEEEIPALESPAISNDTTLDDLLVLINNMGINDNPNLPKAEPLNPTEIDELIAEINRLTNDENEDDIEHFGEAKPDDEDKY
jgi:hypothetical protein